MEKNQRNPRRRLNSLILLVAFTAIMLIVSTYAWFTAQKNVTIGNLKGKVNVAEGLEISLDALNWSQEVDFSDTSKYPTQDALKKLYGPNGTATTDDPNHNIIPSEMIPVSTTGKDNISTIKANGDLDTAGTATELAMYNGKSEVKTASGATSSTTHLSNITLADGVDDEGNEVTDATELDFQGYYAIDLFLRNSSRIAAEGQSETDAQKLARLYDKLQLNAGSELKLQTTSANTTGLQNTVRVAFALYNSTPVADNNSDGVAEGSVDVLATQSQIIKSTTTNGSTGKATIRDVAIWEPNAYDHIDLIKNSQINDSAYRILFSDTDKSLYQTSTTTVGEGSNAKTYDSFGNTHILPTYAIGSAAAAADITNVYDWTTTGIASNKLVKQITLQTDKTASDNYAIAGTAKNLVSVKSTGAAIYKTGTTEAGVENFYIPKNQICRIRMYVWLEGQDIDCVNQASHGGGIELDVGLVKDAEVLS